MEPAGSIFFCCVVAYLLAAPLDRAGIAPMPLLLLELGAVGFLFVILAVQRAPPQLPRTLLAAFAILLAYPLVQIVPIPESWWRALPGHAQYVATLERFAGGLVEDGAVTVRRALSIVPAATEAGWLALFPPLACFLAVMRLRAEHIPKLLLIMSVFAGFQGLLGLLQVPGGGSSIFYLYPQQGYGTAVGTFANQNHLAAMLAMTLPIVVGLLAYSIRQTRRRRHGSGLPSAFNANIFSQRMLLFSSAVLMFLSLLFTRSRAGIVTALFGLACSAILLMRARGGGKQAGMLVLGLIAAGAALAIAIGIAPILERIEPQQLRLNFESRLLIHAATLRAALEFLPFGSGLSTFPSAFPRFQTDALPGFVNYAHNDYLQAFMELGLAAPIVVALLFAAYGARLLDLLRQMGGRRFNLLQLAAAIGLAPMILHSLFDFAMHMPAIAIWVAALAGVMFHPGGASAEASGHRSRAAESAIMAP